MLLRIVLASVLAPLTVAIYRDSLARSKFLPIAAAAYGDDPAECFKHAFGFSNITIVRNLVMGCTENNGDVCAGFSAVSHGDRAIIFSFRGTSSFIQLLLETGETILKQQMPSPIGGKVGYYYQQVFTLLWTNGLSDDYVSLRQRFPNYKIWLTGHSLGAAVASLASATIVSMDKKAADRIQLITFGQPRTGTTDYAKAHDLLLPNSYRVIHGRDPIAHAPAQGLEGYWHHEGEVWYDNDMKTGQPYKVCQEDESNDCSNGLVPIYRLNDHLTYFGVHVSSYGEAGCKLPVS